jgi:S1-C subfamily serine protease
MPALRSALVAALGLTFAHGEDAVSVLKRMDEGFSAVFEKVAPSVVVIEAIRDEVEGPGGTDRPLDFLQKEEEDSQRGPGGRRTPESPSQSEGSGFIIRENGYILTNLHVVDGASKLEVRTYAGKRLPAKLVGSDTKTDIAVIKVEAERLPAVTFGDSDALRIGQLVCAIGAPFSQAYSFTCGWVSGKGRTDLLSRATNRLLFEDYIQTDAFINPGNSGGPLFDVEGRVVGMNTLINGMGRGLAFAIPSNLLRNAADQIIETGRVRRPWLGIRVTSLDDSRTLREQFPDVERGVIVNTFEAEAPAYKSDLQPGDLVTAVDGVSLRNSHELIRHVQAKKVGETLQLTVQRRGQTLNVVVTTGEQPQEISRVRIPHPIPLPQPAQDLLGLKLADADGSGARVVTVVPDSPAARAELKPSDVVTEVNAEPTPSAQAAAEAIQNALAQGSEKGVLVNYVRAGKKSWAVIERPAR